MIRAILALLLLFPIGVQAQPLTSIRIGWCARTVSSAVAPFAIATKLGWFAEAGLKVDLAPLPGSTDCVKLVATGELAYALPSIEPLVVLRPQGVKVKNFYTAYQGNIYGIAVPEASPIQTLADLKGKRIGVTAMASGGVPVARALAASQGLNPDTDIRIIAVGEGGQAAALVRQGAVDALSQFDVMYALVEAAGTKLRRLDNSSIAKFPSNGLIAREDRLAANRAEAVALGRAYAMGTVFAIANPEAAVRILWEVFPQTRGTGRAEDAALVEDMRTLQARIPQWQLAAGGVTKWGENALANYDAYVDFLVKWNVVPQKVAAADLVTNDLIDDINKFDAAAVIARAKAAR
ncbi:MAG: ABC transporter substrate-binding protein [Alphaproteobacteria bacterium]|nr:ABC transporter substrate-binding protein [Alphaproteobacteria bacterium]